MIKPVLRHPALVGVLVLTVLLFLPLRAETLRGPGGLPPGLVAAMLGRMKGKALDPRGCARLGGLRGCFGAGGAKFRGAGKEIELRAVAWGREGKLERLRWKSVGRKGDREVYRGRGIEAWWRVVPLGYEEGFELLRRPQGRGPVEVELEANRVGRKVGGGLRWEGMRYGKLWVTDARGRRVPAELREEGKKIWIRIEGRGWKYPLKVDPLVWVEQAASLPSGLGYFGYSVALSSNGQVAIVGAPYANSHVGAAYVYTYDSTTGTWGSPVALTPPSGATEFGYSVALSGDGEEALVGAPFMNNGNGVGAAYIYTRGSTGWSQPVTLSVPSGASLFGNSVALSSDGEEALVGAPFTNSEAGAAYVYTYDSSAGTWSSPVALSVPSGASEFGLSVALSGDGEIATVGAPNTSSGAGAAYVYTSGSTGWSQPVTLSVPSGASLFGYSVALSSDGEVATVGAPNTSSGAGAAYVYTSGSTGWSQPVTLSVPSGASLFGNSVALSSDGEEALVGVPNTSSGAGASYVYTSSTEAWSSPSGPVTLSAPGGASLFGNSVALSSDGEEALVGAPNTSNSTTGSAYFYSPADLDLVLDAPSAEAPGGQYTEQAILTNDSSYASPDLALNLPIPVGVNYQNISVTSSTQLGPCTTSLSSGVVSSVSCNVESLAANGGSETVSVTLGVPSNATAGTAITETANLGNVSPALSSQAATVVAIVPTLSGLVDETVTVGAAVPSESFTIGGTGTLTVTASSSNTALLPDSGITVSPGCDTDDASCTLTLSPVSGQVGTTTVTVTVEDDYGQEASASFSLTVQSGVPVVSGLEDVSMTVGSPAAVEDFTVSGVGPLSVETQTTNAALLPEGFIELSPSCGSGSGEVVDRCTLTLSPTAGMTGEASVLVTVTDAEGRSATGLVTLYVEPSLGSTSGGTSGGGSVGVGMLLGLLVLVGFKRRKLGGRCG